jgi:hypothetical protein
MTQDTPRQSAKIYQFPVGGRARLAPAREAQKRVEGVRSQRAAKIVYGSGWYHEEAILDDADPSPGER